MTPSNQYIFLFWICSSCYSYACNCLSGYRSFNFHIIRGPEFHKAVVTSCY